jgi:hypothetical protein
MTSAPDARGARRTTVAAAIVALIAVAARTADAQDKRLSARLDTETAAAVARIVDSVRAVGLPADPLVGVALEGASRGAPNDRIVVAVREYAAALGAARRTLGDSASIIELEAAAGIIVAGIAPAVVGEYRAARPSGPLAVPFMVLVDLVLRGVPAADARAALGDALRAGAADSELSELRQRVLTDIAAGANPAVAMSVRTRNLPSVRPGAVAPVRTKSPRLRRPGRF